MKNWWYYHKWYVIGGVLLFAIAFHLISNAFGWFKKTPDLQIAYVGEELLPEETIAAIQQAFSSIAEDYNQDGEILVQLNQYASGSLTGESVDDAQYQQAAELSLIVDINDCQSYFFLLDNPETFQNQHQLLAMPDGSCPDELDFSATDKAISWKDFSLLSEMELGTYTTNLLGQETTGNNQDILSKFYLGRRCFYTEKTCDNAKECETLWNTLKGSME